jgi:hypothetical protein
VASARKPFEQYCTALPDGRRVVEVSIGEPQKASVWLVAASKREALARARELGAPDPHVPTGTRPLGEKVMLAGEDPDGGIFLRGRWYADFSEKKYLPLRELSKYLAGRSDPY